MGNCLNKKKQDKSSNYDSKNPPIYDDEWKDLEDSFRKVGFTVHRIRPIPTKIVKR